VASPRGGRIVGRIVSDKVEEEEKRAAEHRRLPTKEKLLESGTYRRWWYQRKETYLIKNATEKPRQLPPL